MWMWMNANECEWIEEAEKLDLLVWKTPGEPVASGIKRSNLPESSIL